MEERKKATVCDKFKDYDNVELRTGDMTKSALQTVNVYISHFEGKDKTMEQLGAKNGNYSVVVDEKYCSNRILKLIVKMGYTIDNYRYYENYARFAKDKMTKDQPHDPFIDKRFKGTFNAKKGVYEMDVYKVLRSIADEALEKYKKAKKEDMIQNGSDTNRFEGCDPSQMYVSAAATLYEYFNYLNGHKKINDEYKDGISINGTVLSLKKFKYNRVARKMIVLPDVDTIDLSKAHGINDFISLDSWIGKVMSLKNEITDENQLITNAFVFLLDNNITIDDNLSDIVADMQGDGMKPLYDYLLAYQSWYNGLKNE